MTISLNPTGPNSAMIEYSNDTWQNLLDLIDSFLTSHGWTRTKNTFVYGGMTGAKVFEALDKDGVAKKTMVVAYLSTGFLGTIVFESFNPSGTTGVNAAYNSQDITSPGNNCQRLNPTTQNGRLHLFATSKWFVMFNIGTVTGAAYGNAFNGCCEILKANPEDNTPNHVWVHGSYLAGDQSTNGNYVVSPVKTFGFASDPASAGTYPRISTPMGSWGYGNGIANGPKQVDIIRPNPAPFGTILKHQVHDFSIIMDCLSGMQAYVKGKLCGLKAFTTSGAVSGDVFTAKCDSDFFLDINGTDTDHFIFRMTSGACFGIPL